MGAEASHQAGDYGEPQLPEGVLEVRVSVYKLELTGVGFLDHIGAGLAGCYHTGLVVAKEEWAFGGHDMEGKSGVYRTKPELNQDYLFYQRVIMGRVNAAHQDVLQQIRQMARSQQWAGPSYDLIERNCNHFVSDLCWLLLKKRPPEWINGTADGIALGRRRQHALNAGLESALGAHCRELGAPAPPAAAEGGSAGASAGTQGSGTAGQRPSAIWVKPFQLTFEATFELSWKRGLERWRAVVESCPEGADPNELRRRVEEEEFGAAVAAGGAAARAVAAAARAAAEARAEQPQGAGLAAWDRAWANGSSALLRAWREQAAAGQLDADADSEQARERAREVNDTLAAAACAAFAAVEAEEAKAARLAAPAEGQR